MGKVCVIKSCPNSTRKSKLKSKKRYTIPSVSFFRPGTARKLIKWKMSLGIELKSTDTICHFHFKEEHVKVYENIKINGEMKFIPLKKKVLKDEALPTIEHQFISKSHEIDESIIEPIYSYAIYIKDKQQHQEQEAKIKQEDPLENQVSITNLIHDHSYTQNDQEPKQSLLIPRAYVDVKDHWDTKEIIHSIDTLKENIRKITMLPPSWLYVEKPNGLEFMRMGLTPMQIKNHIRLNEDLSMTVILRNNEEYPLNKKINSYSNIYDYLKSMERVPICVGTKVDNHEFSRNCKGVIIGNDTYKRNQGYPRCKSCRIFRNILLRRLHYRKKCSRSLVKSNVLGQEAITKVPKEYCIVFKS